MDRLINLNLTFHTQEVISVGYHKQFLNDLSIVCIGNLVILLLLLIQLLMDLVPMK